MHHLIVLLVAMIVSRRFANIQVTAIHDDAAGNLWAGLRDAMAAFDGGHGGLDALEALAET